MKFRNENLILILILLVGIIIRVYLFQNETFIGTDAISYTRLGKNFIEYGKYAFGEDYNRGIFFPPAYPVAIGAINLFLNDLFLSGKLLSFITSIITIFLLYLTGKELHNKEAGLFAAFAYAIYPTIINITILVESESFFLCFLVLSIYLLFLTGRTHNLIIFSLLGASIAITYLTRPEGLILLFLPFLYTLISNQLKNKKYILNLIIMFLIFILLSAPYILFLKNNTGKLTLSGKNGYLTYLTGKLEVTSAGLEFDKGRFELNRDGTHIKAFKESTGDSLVPYIIADPFKYIKKYFNNSLIEIKVMLKLLRPVVVPLFLTFFTKGLFKNIKLVPVLYPLLLLFIYPLFFIDYRQMFLMVVPFVLLSSIGFANSPSVISALSDFLKIKKKKISLILEKNIKYLIALLLICTSLWLFKSSYNIEIPFEHIKAGYYLKNNISSEYENFNVMSRMPWVNFYSNSKFTSLPYAHYKDVIRFAKLYKVDFIVIDERLLYEWEFYPELVNMENYSDEVELFYENNSEGKIIKLLKVKYDRE